MILAELYKLIATELRPGSIPSGFHTFLTCTLGKEKIIDHYQVKYRCRILKYLFILSSGFFTRVT